MLFKKYHAAKSISLANMVLYMKFHKSYIHVFMWNADQVMKFAMKSHTKLEISYVISYEIPQKNSCEILQEIS